MSYTPRYDRGDWKALCDVCGREYKASQLQQRWDGLMCCRDDWEIRQPQDFVRGVADNQLAPWTRPEPIDSFVPLTFWQSVIASTTSIAKLLTKVVPGKTLSATSTSSVTITKVVNVASRTINGTPINTKPLG